MRARTSPPRWPMWLVTLGFYLGGRGWRQLSVRRPLSRHGHRGAGFVDGRRMMLWVKVPRWNVHLRWAIARMDAQALRWATSRPSGTIRPPAAPDGGTGEMPGG